MHPEDIDCLDFSSSHCEVCGIDQVDLSGSECKTPGRRPCPGCIQLRDVDSRINEMKMILKKLQDERCRIKTLRNKFHDALATALPIELLSRIFIFCLEDHSVPTKCQKGLNVHSPPLRKRSRPSGYVLGAVCKRWREIAHSTPHLWTTVVVRLKDGEVDQCAQFTTDWLSHTGNLPLTLDIYQPEGTQTSFGPPPAFDVSPIFAALNAHSSQWETVVADIHSDLMLLLRGDGNGAPRLRTLDIAAINKHLPQHYPTPPIVFSLAGPTPRPTRVKLHQIRYPSATVTWDSITHLDIWEASVAECYAILQSGMNLVECYIEKIEIANFEAPAPPQQFVLPHLQVLHIRWNDAQEVLLNALTLPSLASLFTNGPLRALPALITRSGCKSTLTELILSDLDTTVFDLMCALENAPLLKQLSVSGLPLDTLFDRLSTTAFFHPAQAHADAQGVFLPHLASLSLFSDPALFSFRAVASIFMPECKLWQEGWKRRSLSRFWLEVSDSDDRYEPLEWHMFDPLPVDPPIIALLRAVKASGVDLRIYDGKGLDLFEYYERDE